MFRYIYIVNWDACNNYYNEALAEGREFIRKVQKEYKIDSLDDEDEWLTLE